MKEEGEEKVALTSPVHPLTKAKNLDDLLYLKKYCIFVLIAIEFMTLTSLTSMVFMVYAGIAPAIKGYDGIDVSNLTDVEACHAFEDYKKYHQNVTPEITYQFGSVNVEFQMYCSEGRLVKDSISIQMLGVLIGAICVGPFSDYYGRRPVIVTALTGISIFSFLVSQAGTFYVFTITRSLVGFFTGILTPVQGVFLIENIPKKHRLWINTVITWSPNFIVLPFFAYIANDWRRLSCFAGVVSGISAFLVFLLEESPRWRIQKGDIEGARQSLERIRRIDKNECPNHKDDVEEMLIYEKELYDRKQMEKNPHQLLMLLRTRKYLFTLIIICYGIVCSSLINYGFLFNMEKLSGSLFWNNSIFGVIRWIMNMSCGLCDFLFDSFGRKKINFFAMMYILPSLAAMCWILLTDNEHIYGWIIRYNTIGVTAMISQLYLAKFMVTSEYFPTSVRNMAVGIMTVGSRIATIVSPQIFYLTDIHPAAPYIVLLCVAFVDWVLFQVFIPETKGRSLENNIQRKMTKNILSSRRESIVEA